MCGRPSGFLPSRLLRRDTSRPEEHFSLVSKEHLPPDARYVALSHCWGSEPADKQLKLLTQNLDAFGAGIPLSDLPKTFRDAFSILEELSIKFLWVDRLCIIQDSNDDWRRESSLMQDIYANSYVTVCAHGAADSSEGCFFIRDQSQMSPHVLTLAMRHPLDETKYLLGDTLARWKRSFEDAPVMKRGWILQERRLSSRLLYFGREQVVWECRKVTCSEAYPDGVLLNKPYELSPKVRSQLMWNIPIGSAWDLFIDLHRTQGRLASGIDLRLREWDLAVAEYTGRKLSKASDKLVAISGLANQVMARLKLLEVEDTYAAKFGPAHFHVGCYGRACCRIIHTQKTIALRPGPVLLKTDLYIFAHRCCWQMKKS